MTRLRQFLLVAALGLGAAGCRSVGPAEVPLPAKLDDRLMPNAKACVDRLNRDRERAQSAINLSDVLVLLGATAGAAGSIAAAFFSKPNTRRMSAVIGAVGALTAGAPKTLDDPAEILTKRARAERHWVVGYKVLTQTMISYEPSRSGPPSKRVAQLTGEAAKAALEVSSQQRQKALLYVLDRFIDCTTDLPPENFEELPPSGFLAVDEPVASAKPDDHNPGTADTAATSAGKIPVAADSPAPGAEAMENSTVSLIAKPSTLPPGQMLPEDPKNPTTPAATPTPSPPSTERPNP